MKRFQEAINKVSTLDEMEALSIFRKELGSGPRMRDIFWNSLTRSHKVLAAAYAMAARFIKESDVLQAIENDQTRSRFI